MAKEALIEVDGTVLELLPDARFRVRLDNEHEIGAYQLSAQGRTRHAVHGCGPAIQPSTVIEETGFASLRRGRR